MNSLGHCDKSACLRRAGNMPCADTWLPQDPASGIPQALIPPVLYPDTQQRYGEDIKYARGSLTWQHQQQCGCQSPCRRGINSNVSGGRTGSSAGPRQAGSRLWSQEQADRTLRQLNADEGELRQQMQRHQLRHQGGQPRADKGLQDRSWRGSHTLNSSPESHLSGSRNCGCCREVGQGQMDSFPEGQSCGSRCTGANSYLASPSKSRSRSATSGTGPGPQPCSPSKSRVSHCGCISMQSHPDSMRTRMEPQPTNCWAQGRERKNGASNLEVNGHSHAGTLQTEPRFNGTGAGGRTRSCSSRRTSQQQPVREQVQHEQGQLQPELQQQVPPAEPGTAAPDLSTMPRAVCPTPFALGPVCGRGERELPNWKATKDSAEILGNCSEIIYATCRYILDVVLARGGSSLHRPLKVLSAADGVSDDTQQDAQARYVPTSVMLAHAFATSNEPRLGQHQQLTVYGGDIRNMVIPFWQPQSLPWILPTHLQHRFVALDNTHDFGPQLYNNSQVENGQFFDVVLLRQALCFCDDPSKVSGSCPIEVNLCCSSCAHCRAILASEGKQLPDVTAIRPTAICGIYRLEHYLWENRPAYRSGRRVLKWCPDRLEWAVLDDADGGAWAYARGDLGHPVLARGPWTVWDGHNHVSDASFACNLTQVMSTPPWYRPPPHRMVCAGVPGDTDSVVFLLFRIAAVLDTSKLDSFGLLHGAWTNGTQVEVEQLHSNLVEAAQRYNDQRRMSGGFPIHAACVLWRTAATQYWLQCDGIMLFQPGSFADPYGAYGAAAIL